MSALRDVSDVRPVRDAMDTGTGTVVAMLDEAQARLDAGQIAQGINGLVAGLCAVHRATSDEEYARVVSAVCLRHPIRHYIHQDPYARRSFEKPRGYAGDALLLDYFYGLHGPAAEETALGKAIFDVSMARSSSESVRYRRQLVARLIDEVAEADEDAQILSVACGHLREASLSRTITEKRVGRLVALDQDTESMAVVGEEAARNNWPVEPLSGSVRSILSGKVKMEDAAFVYAAGLYDYLEMPVAARLTTRMFEMLRSGGRLLVANFAPETEERAYMEAFMDWRLIYRGEAQVAAFADGMPPDQIADQQVSRDPEGNVIYLHLVRR